MTCINFGVTRSQRTRFHEKPEVTLRFGTAPDSWGVWYPSHPSQPSWRQFLDEAAAAKYQLIELGPYGYMPTEPARLREELESRSLSLVAGTMIDDLHLAHSDEQLREHATRICSLASGLGAKFLVLMADGYRGDGGSLTGPQSLDGAQWKQMISNTSVLGAFVRDEFGMTLSFHPHAETVIEYAEQVDQFLNDTDSRSVQLCLDTGHYHYRGGDSAALMRERFNRISYMHLKSIAPEVLARVQREDIGLGDAVAMGVMIEPALGATDFVALDSAMGITGWSGEAIVEQDMFPLPDTSIPLPIAQRTLEFYTALGWST